MKTTFLGTGLIGAAMAEAAIARGEDVTVWNRTASKAEPLGKRGARVASSVADAVRDADRVHVALSDDAAVDAVLDAAGDSLVGRLILDHTTASPAGTFARAARMDATGARFLHTPVFMSPAMCREAKGLMMVAGPADRLDEARAPLEKMTGTVWYVGARPDLAAVYKLFGNAMILATTAGFADVLAIAKAQDVSPADALGLFSRFMPGLGYRAHAMVEGRYDPSFEMTMARKDARLMIEAAEGASLSILPAIAARMDALIGEGRGELDLGALSIESVPEAR